MIQGLDPLGGSSLRHEAIYLEGRGPIAQPDPARALGLAATQVVPDAHPAVGGQWAASDPAASPPPRPTLGQVFASLQSAAVANPSATGASDVMRLLQHVPAWTDLLRLIHSLTQSGTPVRAADSAAWASSLAGLFWAAPPAGQGQAKTDRAPRMGQLGPEGLRQAMAGGGWATEARLMAGLAGVEFDLKAVLRRLLKTGGGGMPEGLLEALRQGVDDLERGQLDTLSAQMQGQVLLHLVIPFGDGGPVALRVFRDRPREDQPDPEFVVDMHSRHAGLGPLWLRTAVQTGQRVALAMWAEEAEVVRRAKLQAPELRYSLAQSGLRLVAFDIHHGPRPLQDDVFAAAP